LALTCVAKMLKHYMLTNIIQVIAPMDLIGYLLQQTVMSGKVARSAVKVGV